MNKFKFILKSITDLLIYIFYKIVFKISNKKYNDYWLISERGIDARDNGYYLYRYIKKNNPEIKVKYVISKDSADYNKIDKEDIVLYRSRKHYYYFMYSKYLISAEIQGFSPNEQLFYRLVKHKIVKLHGKTVFLQHGITKDYNSYLDKDNTKLDLFICGAKREQDYIIKKNKYNKNSAALTGFARFDSLIDNKQNYILIMPTWRKWLKYENTLVGSEFYDNYNKLLNDTDIINLLEEKNYKIIFYPHTILQKHINEFKSNSNRVIIAKEKDYEIQDLFKISNILITDYSSTAFDFAFMNKKVIYFQFDLEKYRTSQYAIGYYNYENDGFGPVKYSFNDLKNELINYLNDPKVYEKYNERITSFFGIRDYNNCKRIINEIKKL